MGRYGLQEGESLSSSRAEEGGAYSLRTDAAIGSNDLSRPFAQRDLKVASQSSALLQPSSPFRGGRALSLIELVEAAGQAAVPTERLQATLAELRRQSTVRLDRFRVSTERSQLKLRLFSSRQPNKRGLRWRLDCLGRLPVLVEGRSSDLADLRSADFYDRNTTITWAPAHSSIYVGRYRIFVERPARQVRGTGQPPTPKAALIARLNALDRLHADAPPVVTSEMALRYERDAELTQLVRELRGHRCQICGHSFPKAGGGRYTECHHLEQLAHGGLDLSSNLLVLCANHHRQFHFGEVKVLSHSSSELVVSIEGKIYRCDLSLSQSPLG